MAFLANYRCGTDMAGAQTLTLNLVVATPIGQQEPETVNGLGTITQAISPPLNLSTQISGVVHSLNGPLIVAAMVGRSFAGEQNFQGVLALPDGWGKPGTATYWYVVDGQQIHVGPVPAEPIAAQKAA